MVGKKSPALYSIISQATERVSIGQLDEIREMRNFHLKEEQYLQIITHKTASLFAAACQSGGMSCPGGAKFEANLQKFGEALGIAFQITDDLLDYVGSSTQVGKEVGKDLLEGKVTLPLLAALHQAPADEKERTIDFLENGYSRSGFARILEFVTKWGGLAYSRQKAHSLGEKAGAFLAELPDSIYKQRLNDLVEFAVQRQK
jgi:octaprenyl-diphosphate synthase